MSDGKGGSFRHSSHTQSVKSWNSLFMKHKSTTNKHLLLAQRRNIPDTIWIIFRLAWRAPHNSSSMLAPPPPLSDRETGSSHVKICPGIYIRLTSNLLNFHQFRSNWFFLFFLLSFGKERELQEKSKGIEKRWLRWETEKSNQLAERNIES